MKTKSTGAQAGQAIRQQIKELGIKAFVRASANSVSVNIQQDVPPSVRRVIERLCDKYKLGSWDSQSECYDNSNKRDDLPQVRHVQVHFIYSAGLVGKARSFAQEYVLAGTGLLAFEVEAEGLLSGDAIRSDAFWKQYQLSA